MRLFVENIASRRNLKYVGISLLPGSKARHFIFTICAQKREEEARVRAGDPTVTNCHRLLINARYLYTETLAHAAGTDVRQTEVDKRGTDDGRGAHVGVP